MTTLLALAVLVVAIFILTGGFAAAKLYLAIGATPADVVTLRYIVGALALAPFVIAARRRLARDPGWWRATLLALVGGVPFGALVFVGVSGAPLTHGAGVVPAVAVIVGMALARFVLGEPLGPRRLVGVVCALGGLAVLVGPDLDEAGTTWWGEAAYVGAGVLWGTFTVTLRAFRLGPLEGAALASTFSLPYLPIYLLFLDPRIPELPWLDTVAQGLYQGIAFQTLAIVLYGWAVSRLGAASAVAAMPLMPLFGTLMDWALFGHEPHALVPVAIVAMGVGVWLAAGPQATLTRSPPAREGERGADP